MCRSAGDHLTAFPSCLLGHWFFLELGAHYLFSCCNLFKCCSWHSHLSCSCTVIIWDLSVNFKVEVLNFYRHAQYSRFQKHSCIFSKLECSFKVFKFHVRFRFWIRVWEGNSFFFLSVRFKPNFFKIKVGCEDLFYDVEMLILEGNAVCIVSNIYS